MISIVDRSHSIGSTFATLIRDDGFLNLYTYLTHHARYPHPNHLHVDVHFLFSINLTLLAGQPIELGLFCSPHLT